MLIAITIILYNSNFILVKAFYQNQIGGDKNRTNGKSVLSISQKCFFQHLQSCHSISP